MSDSVNLEASTQAPVDDQEQRSAAAAGAMLRRARENAGLHVAALATALKVPVKKLEALEAGRIDLLPDPTFARGLAASICRGLKVDPQPVLDLMPHYAGTHRVVEPPAINTRFQPSSGEPHRWKRPSPAALAVLLLLLGALAIYFFPDMVPNVPPTESAAPAEVPAATPPVPEPPPQAGAPAATAVEPAAPPAAPAVQAAASSAPPASAPAADAASQPVVFQARAESWVQVTDAKGVVVLRRTLQPGETVASGGALPLSVVVGRIDAVQVQVRGTPMDLAPVAKNNVARFEVK